MRILLIILAFGMNVHQRVVAQQPVADLQMQLYQSALQIYKANSYARAYESFSRIESEISDRNSLVATNTRYYKSRSAMQLFHKDAEDLMKSFLNDYPNSTMYYEACRNLADYYSQKRDYTSALVYYQQIDIAQIRKKFRDSYKFQYAYCLFELGDYKAAAAFFHDLLSNDNEYSNKSKYYFAYTTYIDSNFATAKKYFLELIDEGLYLDELPLYVAQIYHQQASYDDVLDFSLKYVDSINQESTELYKLIAEAYYHKKEYTQCIYYFDDKYLQTENKLDDLGYYLLGQAYYRNQEYSLASAAFNKIIEAEDSLAQNAYYYLADCYLELGDKRSAQNAFESASYYNFNNRITEHSNFNFAKLCYELGYPYADPTMILQDFINDFPESEYIDETYSYLVNAFLTHKDYSRAIKSMEANGLENIRLQQAYQEVSYYRAVQLFNDGNYTKAVAHFNKALVYNHNKNYEALSYFWKAESEYRLEQFETSINTYGQFQNSASASTMPEFESASYHKAYAYFKLWEFSKSLKAFEAFAGNVSDSDMRLHDAYTRMGDANYMLKDYSRAIEHYSMAVELWGVDADYSAYQIALAYQQLNEHQNVVESLEDFGVQFTSSTYRDDAYYRMGESYIQLHEPDKAIAMFKKVESLFPNSAYLANARMKIGLVLYNKESYQESIAEFKSIVATYPATSIAREAISNARSVYVDLGDVQAYADWIETLSFVHISFSALDSTSYESAELQYLKSNYSKAYTGFESYLINYKEGLFKLPAHYYFAQSAKEIDSLDQALAAYEVVNSYHNNNFTSNSLKQAAILFQDKGLFDKAIERYLKLDMQAEDVESQLFAKKGLMTCYFELAEYDHAIEQAELILNSARVDQSLILEINTFVARAAFLNLDRSLAAEKYLFVEGVSQGDLKAEAMYHLAYLAFYEGDYEVSKQIIFEQSRLLPLYKNWLGKSFIVLAKNYWEEEDVFQATHTLEQLILNIDDEVTLKEARRLKAEILSKEDIPQKMSLGLDSIQQIDTLQTTEE